MEIPVQMAVFGNQFFERYFKYRAVFAGGSNYPRILEDYNLKVHRASIDAWRHELRAKEPSADLIILTSRGMPHTRLRRYVPSWHDHETRTSSA